MIQLFPLTQYAQLVLASFTGSALFWIVQTWMQMYVRKKNQPPPHPFGQLIQSLKKQGIPFEIMRGGQPSPPDCQCPACTARREIEKQNQGGGDGPVLH